MHCCLAEKWKKPPRPRWRGIAGFTGSGALLLLVPKCPMCVAAYLALWTGASVATPIATRLRPMLEIAFAASALLLLVRLLLARRTRPL